jgi:hypothetical protein
MAPSIHGERARRRGCRGRAPLRDLRREGEGGTMVMAVDALDINI